MKAKILLSASTSLLTLSSAFVNAQSVETNKNYERTYTNIEQITVLGKSAVEDAELGGVSLKALPINTHVVGRAEIERIRFVDPNELLDRIPGETQVRNLRIPDGGKSYTIPLVDGIPLENPYEGATSRLDRVNTSDIERVEVIKGPASALYFNNAFGGIVNVVTRAAPLESETQVSVEAGDFNRLRLGVNTGGTIGNVGYFFDVNSRDIEGLRDEVVDERQQVSGKLIYQLSDATQLTTRLEYLDQFNVNRADLTSQELADDPTQAGNLESLDDIIQTTVSFKLKHTLEAGQLDIDLVRREKNTIGDSRFRPPQDENDLGISTKLVYRHDLGVSSLTGGYEGYHGEQNTDEFDADDLELQGDFFSFTNNLNINAYFAQYQVNATDDLVVTAGLRFENIHLSSSNFDQNGDFSDLAPKLGLTYQINPNHMVWVGISEGLYAPNIDDLFDINEGNPDLDPEEATNVEIGFRGNFGNWYYDTSFYNEDIKNFLVTQELFRTVDGELEEFELVTNAGQVSIKGIESVVEYTPENTNWRLGLTHTYTRNTYDSFVQSAEGADDDLSGNILRRSPDHHFNARIAWTPIETLTLELEGDFYSSYFADNANSPESEFTRGERINLRVNYQLNQWRLWFHALNITDTQEDRATFSRDQFTFRTIDGRTLYAGASYNF